MQPQILFLMEEKLNGLKMEQVKAKCDFTNEIDVEEQGSRGGLSIGWKEDLVIQLQSYSANHIDVVILEKDRMPT